MTITRKLSTITTVALLAASGVAVGADAPVVSAQKTLTAKTVPITIPGTGLKKGQRLPAGARIVYREVTLQGRQSTRLTLRAPAAKTLRGLAPAGDVAFAVIDRGSYVGRRKVSVRAYKNPNVGGEVSGQIYALAR